MSIKAFSEIKPARFAYVMRFVVEKVPIDGGGWCSNVEVTLVEDPKNSPDGLFIRFVECREIKVGNVNEMAWVLLNISDFSDHGWEGVAYRVVDDEASYFSLYCRDFEFSLRKPDSR